MTTGDKVRLGLVAVIALVAVVAAGLGIRELKTQEAGWHVTECGFDAYGPYAKVRADSLYVGLGAADHGIIVDFTYAGAWYDSAGARIKRGTTTAILHGTYPPRVIDLHWDGGPKGKMMVEGRTVYRIRGWHEDGQERWPGILASQEYALEHPRKSEKEIVPDDLQKIGCSVHPPTDD